MRASDIERQRTIDELRRHCAAGRIDVDDFASRIERAMTSSTLQELDQLLADLPMLRIADPVGLLSERSGGGGSGRDGLSDDETTPSGVVARLSASMLVLLTVMVVVTAVFVAVLASWAWSVVLLAAWLVGIGQGRLSRRLPWPPR
jgi:hypothetical protein